jgi:hypothetical protein
LFCEKSGSAVSGCIVYKKRLVFEADANFSLLTCTGGEAGGVVGGQLDRGQPHLPQAHLQHGQRAQGWGRQAGPPQLLPEPPLALAQASRVRAS